jgi:hypothetical protein
MYLKNSVFLASTVKLQAELFGSKLLIERLLNILNRLNLPIQLLNKIKILQEWCHKKVELAILERHIEHAKRVVFSWTLDILKKVETIRQNLSDQISIMFLSKK